MSLDYLNEEQFKRLRERFLASVRVAQDNNAQGVVFRNGQGPMEPRVRELLEALLDDNYQPKKPKRSR